MFSKRKVTMEWGVYEDYVAIVAWCGYTTSKIHITLKLLKLNLHFIQCTIKQYKETGLVDNWISSSRPWMAQMKEVMKAVRARVVCNPSRKRKILS